MIARLPVRVPGLVAAPAALIAALIIVPVSAQSGTPAPTGTQAVGTDHADAATGDADSSDDIVVVGDNGSSVRLTADSLRDAAEAYRAHRDEFAPASNLYFRVDIPAGSTRDGLLLYLRARARDADGTHAIIDLTVDDQGLFLLPIDTVITGGWELRTNRRRGGIRIRPLVLSPGSEIADRRFGDMRLQCRVSVAFARLNLFTRALAGAVNVCNNRRIRLFTRSPQPLASATVSSRSEPLQIGADGISFQVPLSDESIGNDDRLRLTYR